MATDKELSDFLASVEKKAFKQAVYAVRKDESALDVVQDAMIKLAEKYGDRRRIRFETDRAQFFIIKTVETELLLTDQKLPSATVVVRTAA